MGYADRFIGGKGIASRLYWELVSKGANAFSPDNHLFMINGPLTGIRATAASRWVTVSRSPLTFPEQYSCSNLGGYFGAALKWAGLDGLDIYGLARKPVILLIEPGARCTFEDATGLWGKNTFETIAILQGKYGKNVSVATIGEAGERLVRFANVICTGGTSGSKGFGAVMGSKNLKAIVVLAPKVTLPVARPDDFKQVIREINALTIGEASGRYHNEVRLDGVKKVKPAYCYGCLGVCRRGLYRSDSGEEGYRINCNSAFFYRSLEIAKTGTKGSATFHATQLANKHGLCALQLSILCKWLPKAIRSGAIVSADSVLKPDQAGTSEWIQALVDMIINRQGIGEVLAEGNRRAAKEWGVSELLEGITSQTGTSNPTGHDPRLYLALAPIFATEANFVTSQLHELEKPIRKWMEWNGSDGKKGFLNTEKLFRLARLFWGSEGAAEFSLPEIKGATAAHLQNRAYAKENLVACDWFWPINYSGNAALGTGDPTLEPRLFSAVTGENMDEIGYLRSGERCFNQNRAIFLREGRQGRQDDILEERFYAHPYQKASGFIADFNPECLVPGPNGKLVSRKGAKLDKEVFEQIMDDYYQAFGWDVESGLFKKDSLENLGLADMIPELERDCYIS
jgi:aldehyde:ferredoxin oxidoreductase